DPIRRAWAIRMLIDLIVEGPDLPFVTSGPTLRCTTPIERLAFASAMTRVKVQSRLPMVAHLFKKTAAEDARDPNLPLMVWYATEPLIDGKRETILDLLSAANVGLLREYIARRATSSDP